MGVVRWDRIEKVWIGFALALLGAFALIGCQAAQQPPAAAPSAQSPSAAVSTATESIKVGLTLPMTGPSAANAIRSERWFRMSIEEVNAKGIKVGSRTYRFEAVNADDRYSSEGAREAANRLVLGEKVKFIMGGASSSTPGAQPITEPNKVIILASGGGDQMLGTAFPYTVVVGTPHPRMRAGAIYEWFAKTYPEAKRLSYILSDDGGGKTYLPLAEATATQLGRSVVAKEFFPLDTKDFSPLVTRLLRESPDAIDIGPSSAYGPLFVGMIRALSEQGYRKPLIGIWGDTTALRQAGSAAEGFVFTSLTDHKSAVVGQREKEAIQRFIQTYGESELDLTLLSVYNAPLVLAQAIERSGSVDDTEKIVKAMREGEWDTLYGKARFVGAKSFGLPAFLETPIYLSKVEGGKLVTFQRLAGTLP